MKQPQGGYARLGLALNVVDDEGPSRTVLVTGEVDLVSSGFLRETLAALSSHGGDVTVDLTDVTFADTTLGYVLVDFQSDQSDRGDALRIVNIPPRVRRMLVLGKFAEPLGLLQEDGRVPLAAGA